MNGERKYVGTKRHPKTESNCLSQFLFGWPLSLSLSHRKRELTELNYETLKEHRAHTLGNRLERLWMEEENCGKNPSLLRALLRLVGKELFLYGLFVFVSDMVVSLVQPYCLQAYLTYLTDGDSRDRSRAIVFVSIYMLSLLVRTLTSNWSSLQLLSLGMKARIACSSLIYRQCLKTRKRLTVAQITNILSNDATRFNDTFLFLHYLWIGVVKVVVIGYYMGVVMGPTALTGMAVMVVFVIIEMLLSKQIATYRMRVAAPTDQRIRLISNILSGIQTVKMYTWEKPFGSLIRTSRKAELRSVFKSNLLRNTVGCFRLYFSKIAPFVCILAATLLQGFFDQKIYFPLINIYHNLNVTMIIRFQMGLMDVAEALASVKRIQDFLLIGALSEIKDRYVSTNLGKGVFCSNVSVSFNNKVFLEKVCLRVRPGECVGLAGASGSGKSTLLQLLLGEITPDEGCITVSKKISYSSQEPWIFGGTIRQNILFGEELDQQRYLTVLRVCAFEHDLRSFAHGDQTLVGEKGVTLSGGQRARVNLARAVYRDADVYLLDDPLAAVDGHVAEHIFEECVMGYLKTKSVILVSHQPHCLERISRVCFIDHGVLTESSNKTIVRATPVTTTLTEEVKVHHKAQAEAPVSRYNFKQAFVKFFTSEKSLILPITVVTLVLSNIIDCYIDFLVPYNLVPDPPLTTKNFLYLCGGLCCLLMLLTHVQIVLLTTYFKSISRTLHRQLLDNILSAPIKFFQTTPVGTVLTRFSQDFDCIDQVLPFSLTIVLTYSVRLLGALVVMSVLNYWFTFLTVVLLLAFYISFGVFERVSRGIRRMESEARSPVVTHLVATLRGLPTVRAHQMEETLAAEFDNLQDRHSTVLYLCSSLLLTLTFWIDLECIIYTVVATYTFCVLDADMISTGLGVTYTTNLILLLQYGMKMLSDSHAYMVSVERVLEYQGLEVEKDVGAVVPPGWPQLGQIRFKAVSLQYHPDKPSALKDLNFTISPGEKVGIVGRTGAGKSSLLSVLFRLFNFHGRVSIDGVDITTVPLTLLRSKIFIIPQEPVLFVGTVRKNLDFFDEFSDAELWDSLGLVNLKDLDLGLETVVGENGMNLSVGQKQLLCLGRAVLRRPKIVVFDEATASVDLETDKLIQGTIRDRFRDCTVLTIAHRLNTVMDSDKILMMEDGRVVEFDAPEEVMKRRRDSFRLLE